MTGRSGNNAERSNVTGMTSERDNEPLSDVAPDDSAGKRGHGAHGSAGRTPAERDEGTSAGPDSAKGSDRGAAGWGSESAGGSVIDKRGPEGK
jgi:hypothetical protein